MDITKNKAYTTKAKNVSNRDMHEYVIRLQPFENHTGSCHGQWRGKDEDATGYAVYSYGSHFPIYFYSVEADRWFGNADKYSRTTTNHQSRTRPCDSRDITWMGTGNLKYLVTHGYVAYVANRMNLKGEQ